MRRWRSGGRGAVPLRRALPENSRDLTRLDPEAIRQESENAWPRIRDADELHDALLTLGVLSDGPDAPAAPAAFIHSGGRSVVAAVAGAVGRGRGGSAALLPMAG